MTMRPPQPGQRGSSEASTAERSRWSSATLSAVEGEAAASKRRITASLARRCPLVEFVEQPEVEGVHVAAVLRSGAFICNGGASCSNGAGRLIRS